MDNNSPLAYFKGMVLWNLFTNQNPHVTCILNPTLDPNDLSVKIQKIKELIDDKISGYRFYRKPGAFVDDFTLEKGTWTKEEYLHDWTYFSIYHSQDFNKTIVRLIRSIYYFSQENNIDIGDLLDELWAEYWIIDIETYAFIRHQFQYNDFEPSIEDIEDLYIQVSDKISIAKTETKNLDEWIENLHSIIPTIMYGILISNFKNEEALRYNRFFEEAKADIIAVFGIALHGVIIDDNLIFTTNYAPLNEDNEETFLRKLKYTYSSRISIPKYWCELAKECYNNIIAVYSFSEIMNSYDIFKLIGMFCHLSTFHMNNCLEYIATGKLPQIENGEIYLNE